MYRGLFVLALGLGILLAGGLASAADSPRSNAAPGDMSAATAERVLLAQAESGRAGQPVPGPRAVDPAPVLRKPSGFWTSGRPAVGGAYRYRLLAIGTGVFLCMGAMMIWVIRRHPLRRSKAE